MSAARESMDARLARTEAAMEGLVDLITEKFDALDKRLSERCNGNVGRIEALEKSVVRLGERVGGLEAKGHRQDGGILAISKTLAAGAALGGLLVKLLEGMKL